MTMENTARSLYYAGVGSRETPQNILVLMADLAEQLGALGHTLRSGGAIGADRAFEKGADRGNYPKEIFYAKDCTTECMGISKLYHPAWSRLSEYAKQLHGRNVLQILGEDLQTPVEFVVCWTPDGCVDHTTRTIKTGGTGTAISVASERNIPVFNLQIHGQAEKVLEHAK